MHYVHNALVLATTSSSSTYRWRVVGNMCTILQIHGFVQVTISNSTCSAKFSHKVRQCLQLAF